MITFEYVGYIVSMHFHFNMSLHDCICFVEIYMYLYSIIADLHCCVFRLNPCFTIYVYNCSI